MKGKALGLILTLLVVVYSPLSPAWELARNSDGIKVYTELPRGSDFKAFYAVTHVQATLRQLVAMQLHLASQPDWIQDCEKSELVKRVSDREFYVYYVTHAPWPVDDRDYVLHSVIDQDPASLAVTVHFQGVDNMLGPTKNCVRAAEVKGFWRFTPEPGKQVKVEYQVHADPSGNVPAWLANSFVVDQPYQTLQKLREHLDDPQYKDVKTGFIIEPQVSQSDLTQPPADAPAGNADSPMQAK